MQFIRHITAEEMVAVFLSGELASPRWGKDIANILAKYNIDQSIITSPDLDNHKENQQRADILGEFRGYGRKDGLFDDIGPDIRWQRVLLETDDFAKIRYIAHDYWTQLSGGTGLVIDGAKNVRAGREVFEVSNQQYWQVAEVVHGGGQFPSVILLMDQQGSIKLLEGHVRLTGVLLADPHLPSLEAIVGLMP